MSFINLPESTSKHHENSQNNFNSSQNYLNSIEIRSRTVCEPEEFPKTISNIEHCSDQLAMSFNYEKCFDNTFEYSTNSGSYSGENIFEFPSGSQSFNNTDQLGYNFNAENPTNHQQMSKF